MGPEHVLFMDEVMLVKNEGVSLDNHKEHLHQIMAVEAHLRSLTPYSDISIMKRDLPTPSSHKQKADVLIFSEDSPLHLYACLESLHAKAQDVNDIYVIYQSHDYELSRAYLNLKNEFVNVTFMDVCDYPGSDFKSFLAKALANHRYGAPYLLITDDHYVFDQTLKFHECSAVLGKIHADYFFLLIDENVLAPPLPEAIEVGAGIYAWQMGEEGQKQSPLMSIVRKEVLANAISSSDIKDVAGFEHFWKRQLPSHSVALFYEEKKVLPLKCTREPTLTQKKDWGHKFIEGYKIDIPSLLCEMGELQGEDYPLIKRVRKRPFK